MQAIADRRARVAGVQTRTTQTVPKGKRPQGSEAGRSPLVNLFPSFRSFKGWMHQLAIPAGTTITNDGVYLLNRLRIGKDTAQEMSLCAIKAETMATDVDGTATEVAGPAAWGSASGIGVQVVVGVNMRLQEGEWNDVAMLVPGVDPSGHGSLSVGHVSPYLFNASMPPGKWTDATLQKFVQREVYEPREVRLPEGSTLDIALVVPGAQIQAGANKTLVGFVDVTCTIGLTEQVREYGN